MAAAGPAAHIRERIGAGQQTANLAGVRAAARDARQPVLAGKGEVAITARREKRGDRHPPV